MYYDMEADLELFQDLDHLLLNPVNTELIDSSKIPSELVYYNPRTIRTIFSPQDLDDASLSNATCFSNSSPIRQMSPNNKIDIGTSNNLAFEESFFYLNNLPEVNQDLTPVMMNIPTHTKIHDRTPLIICQDDAMNKYAGFDETQEIKNNMVKDISNINAKHGMNDNNQKWNLMDFNYPLDELQGTSNDIVITEYTTDESVNHGMTENKLKQNLMLNVPAPRQSWYSDVISTPDVLNYVVQLETNNDFPSVVNEDPCAPAKLPLTPKSELEDPNSELKAFFSKKLRRHSEESDDIYIPHAVRKTPKTYKQQQKLNVPTKDTLALEGLHQSQKVKRGRPPKRRNSVVSVCSSESRDASMSYFPPDTYRMLRDKNNEASKRSRMKKKLKELEMQQLVADMEVRNRELTTKVATLEELTKKLRETFKSILLDT